MCDVIRELDNELYNSVVSYVYESFEYLVTLDEVKEYVRLVTVDLAEKKISAVKQDDIINMVSKLIIEDANKLVVDGESKKTCKTFKNNVTLEDRYALVFKSAYRKLDENEQLIINNAMFGTLNEEDRCEYLSAVMKLVSIILEDDAYAANVVLYEMLNKGYSKKRSK